MARRKPTASAPEPTPAPTPASAPAPPPPTGDVHCAQRGCTVPRKNANDAFCPVCNHPLHLIEDL